MERDTTEQTYARRVIAGAIETQSRYWSATEPCSPHVLAVSVAGYLDQHGFEIVRKAKPAAAGADLLSDVLREAVQDAYDEGCDGRPFVGAEAAARLIRELRRVGLHVVRQPLGTEPAAVARRVQAQQQRAIELGLAMPAGSAARVAEARRTGKWSAVSDADWKAWVNVLRQGDPTAAAEFLPTYQDLARLQGLYVRGDGTVAPLDKAAIDAGVVGIIERELLETPVVFERGRTVEMPPGTAISAPAADPDGDEEPERDTWGVRACLADDMAARHGCRVELSGIDDPHMPLTYVDDLTSYAVVTERVSGRLVGIVECWQSEDGDYIVPRSWLETTLSAWDAKSHPMRAA